MVIRFSFAVVFEVKFLLSFEIKFRSEGHSYKCANVDKQILTALTTHTVVKK